MSEEAEQETVNERLDRIEKRLDELEERMAILEKTLVKEILEIVIKL